MLLYCGHTIRCKHTVKQNLIKSQHNTSEAQWFAYEPIYEISVEMSFLDIIEAVINLYAYILS